MSGAVGLVATNGADRTRSLVEDVTWRAQVEARTHELEDDLSRVRAGGLPAGAGAREAADNLIAEQWIRRAQNIAATGPRLLSWTWIRRWASGSDCETAWNAVHNAEAALVMILPVDTVKARLADLRAGLGAALAGDGRLGPYETRLMEIEELDAGQIGAAEREEIRCIKAAVDSTSDAAHSNIRNYRNWLLLVSSVVAVGLVTVALAHAVDPSFLYVAEANSAGGADVAQLEAAGAVGGLLMALFALIRLTVYAGPVALPMWQAMVRVPAGAAAALVGALLLQGQVLNSIMPQSRTGLLGYAVLFGAAPEILLRLLDRKVNEATTAARTKNDPLKTVPAQGAGKSTRRNVTAEVRGAAGPGKTAEPKPGE